ncbi:hypothetical protein PVL29_011799 [Vitis rotundifolia]|uniref:Rapid ALkalinization Factor n=1 Tax=Vitis rotundifolia TaxID=103349 RepID=A0AA39DQ29_VITRO|nr:hypothetical protein PVL29_011799 [Vitis rotundifolia]
MGVGHLAVLLVTILVLINPKCYRATHMVEMKSSSSAWCRGSIEECLMMDVDDDDDDVEQDLEMLIMESQVISRMLGDKGKPHPVTSTAAVRNATLSCGKGKSYTGCLPTPSPHENCGTYKRDCKKRSPPHASTIFS